MFFEFNSTRSLSRMDDVYACLNKWSQNMPSIICKKTEAVGTLILIIDSTSTIKIREATAKHKYKSINEMTAFGPPELSKHYNLKIKGKNDEGKNFIFRASLSYDSENGGSS